MRIGILGTENSERIKLRDAERTYWAAYLSTLPEKPQDPQVEASIAGNLTIADELLHLYLNGQKRAGSSLLRDYEQSGESLPKVGNFWIILDAQDRPGCIVKTTKVVVNRFKNVSVEIAVAEGEGDLSLDYWRRAHREFFTPFLERLGINDLDEAEIVTEFFELVYRA